YPNIEFIHITKDESKGGNYARNMGIKRAQGKYVAFCDDDDYWISTKIEEQLKIFKENEDVGAVYCGYHVQHRNGEIFKAMPKTITEESLDKYILYHFLTLSSALIVKKDLLFQVGLFDENLKFWQDYELTIRLAQITRFEFVPDYLMVYLRDLSDKNRLTNKFDSWFEAVEYIHKKHKALYDKLNWFENLQYKYQVLRDAEERTETANLVRLYRRFKVKRKFLKYVIWLVRFYQNIKN
ncbi:MAG TPA: glycosyltransferase, partial [Bacteroidales bacterium]|nr:glycosyltransferase [Bacteroidales bacterium]